MLAIQCDKLGPEFVNKIGRKFQKSLFLVFVYTTNLPFLRSIARLHVS